ncbi:glutaredoxin family protein [Nesterenkonia aurantiaca]|uniref:glutaredoxin family protein n=1 Tax=Nesterenkonia aurantiaca TaxID=1436010 RepID=UPI003EE760D8
MPAPTAITVYTKPGCPPCGRTKFVLQREGLPFEEIDMTRDAQTLEAVKALGYAQAPVVVVRPAGATEDVHWSGLNPDKLAEHCINPVKEEVNA